MSDQSDANKKRLHVGCGRKILPGWVNLDRVPGIGIDVVADLDQCAEKPLPFESDTFDEFLASHIFEHLHNPLPFMQELHRVAKPGGRATFRVPYGSSDDAYEDPTHVRQCFFQTFNFFAQPFYFRADYGYRGDWQPMEIRLLVNKKSYLNESHQKIFDDIVHLRNVVQEMIVELVAIKPIREAKAELRQYANAQIVLVDQ